MNESNPTFLIRTYQDADEESVIDLWHRCNLIVPSSDPQRDIRLKMEFQPHLFFVGTVGGEVIATIMVGYEGHRGWINYLAVSPDHQHQGFGRRMMEAAEVELRKLGCPKINLQVRSTNKEVIVFYERLGYIVEERVSMGRRLELE